MEALYKLNDKLTLKVDGTTQKELFEKVAEVEKWSEVFGIEKCGVCGCKNIKLQTREAADKKKQTKMYTFYELVCQGYTKDKERCYAKLQFGQHSEGGTLFPKRKDDDGNYLPNGGWKRFVKDEEGDK